jgi:hypothetical protein
MLGLGNGGSRNRREEVERSLHTWTLRLTLSLSLSSPQESFDVISLGTRHIHLAGPDGKLDRAAKPSALMVVETAKYMLQLKKEQVRGCESLKF